MAAFFKKLFGIKEPESKPSEQSFPSVKYSVEVEFTQSQPNTELIKKEYDISEIKKQSTEIKNKEGFLNSINFIQQFIETQKIEFLELFSLLKKAVPYMKKEKTIQDTDILKYINIQIEKFAEKDELEYQSPIAELLSQVDNNYGLEYLEMKLSDFEKDKKLTLAHFDSIILLSDFYLKNKQGNKAFQTISRATILVTNFNNKFDYLGKQRTIAEKSANIFLKGQIQPKNADYIHFHIILFILDVYATTNILGFHSTFFFSKNKCFNEGWWGFEENEDFEKALIDLKIQQHKKELLNDIYNFTFNELPLLMGFPIEYLNEKTNALFTECSDDFNRDNPKWGKLFDALIFFDTKPFFEIAIIHEFAAKIVKKYYDMENA